MKLREDLWDAKEKAPTRDGFGKDVVEAGKADERVDILSADLAESTRAEWFQKEFPTRYIEMSVAEQNMATVAAGMANYGKPTVIIAHTIPGKGIKEIEKDFRWHGKPPKAEEAKKFLEELRTLSGKISSEHQ